MQIGTLSGSTFDLEVETYTRFQTTKGGLVEWLCSGLQIRVHRFDSGTRLHNIITQNLNKNNLLEARLPSSVQSSQEEVCATLL